MAHLPLGVQGERQNPVHIKLSVSALAFALSRVKAESHTSATPTSLAANFQDQNSPPRVQQLGKINCLGLTGVKKEKQIGLTLECLLTSVLLLNKWIAAVRGQLKFGISKCIRKKVNQNEKNEMRFTGIRNWCKTTRTYYTLKTYEKKEIIQKFRKW